MSEDNVHQDPSSDVSSQLSKLDLERGADQGQVLVERCRVLLDELEVFQNFLQNENKETAELRHFKSSVKTECKLLEKVIICSVERKSDLSDSYLALQVGSYSTQDCSYIKIEQFPILFCGLGCCERLYGGCGVGETLPLAVSREFSQRRERLECPRPEPKAY
jgi:hypothetical protein